MCNKIKNKKITVSLLVPLFLVFFVNTIISKPKISLSVTDDGGYLVKQIQQDDLLELQVTVSNDKSTDLPEPEIKGLDDCTIVSKNIQQSTVVNNGKKTVSKKIFITLKLDQLKTYTIGPALIEYDGSVEKSESFDVQAVKQLAKKKEQSVFTSFNFDVLNPYVGQKIMATLRFYYTTTAIQLESIKRPQFQDLLLNDLQGPTTGTQEVNGIMYRYLEWKSFAYCQKPGVLRIDPVQALYSVETKQNRHPLFDFSDFFQKKTKLRHSFSKPIELDVKALPESEKEIKAIGHFEGITAKLANETCSQDEGVVLTLTLLGDGNMEMIDHPELVLPDDFTSYSSASKIKTKGSFDSKQFEYIIQALEPGEFTLKPQSFTYFDLKNQTYKTIKTNQLTLKVVEKKQVSSKQKENAVLDQSENHNSRTKQRAETISPILTKGEWKQKKIKTISFWNMLLVMLLPILMMFYSFLNGYIQEYYKKYAALHAYKKAFKTARQGLSNARHKGYSSQLYCLFIQLFADRWYKKQEEVTEQMIQNRIKKAGWNDQKIQEWNIFFGHIVEYAFSSYGTTKANDTIFNQASFWIHELEKII